ncbi:hypothetical protein I6F30_30775 [Bradyrhizobium sp. NBAIM20]|uniref:hypothetical protein n=1 Tax=unclassified Bradyrhizobium TaxID=2631580 RepID=UPI001CD7A035|nr:MULTISPECIES: hypothetical protein [unclassified Bradyrhizobium]MCA1415481.1 hypothetical protein [Bradyrhizobium sp. NBAIM20]MCA1460895.1 hypothetical protein [Bradyrhizobium sp. NBAIM18]
MKTFRAVVLTLEGEIILTIALVCATEDEAKARAEDLLEDDPVELWDGPRRIARFQPEH